MWRLNSFLRDDRVLAARALGTELGTRADGNNIQKRARIRLSTSSISVPIWSDVIVHISYIPGEPPNNSGSSNWKSGVHTTICAVNSAAESPGYYKWQQHEKCAKLLDQGNKIQRNVQRIRAMRMQIISTMHNVKLADISGAETGGIKKTKLMRQGNCKNRYIRVCIESYQPGWNFLSKW
jgi:hypothetical protein